MSQNSLFGGHDLTRRETLMYLDDVSLESYCLTNKEAAAHCNDEQFWKDRIAAKLESKYVALLDDKPDFLSYKIAYLVLSEVEKFEKRRHYTRGPQKVKETTLFERRLARKLVPRVLQLNYTRHQMEDLTSYIENELGLAIQSAFAVELAKAGRVEDAIIIAGDEHNLIAYLPPSVVKKIAQDDVKHFKAIVEEFAREKMLEDEELTKEEAYEMALEDMQEEDDRSPIVIFHANCKNWPVSSIMAYIEGAELIPLYTFTPLIESGQFEAAYQIYRVVRTPEMSTHEFIQEYVTEYTSVDFQTNLINFFLVYSVKFSYNDLHPGGFTVASMYLMEKYKIYPTEYYLLSLTAQHYDVAISILQRNGINY